MKNIAISRLRGLDEEEQKVEYVERKGIGHPDSLIDGIVDRASVELSKEYLKRFGAILHHNVDKGLIIGGSAEVDFGHAKLTNKIEAIVTGRATDSFNGEKVDVNGIAEKAAGSYLREHTRFLNIDSEVDISAKIRKGSTDLNGIFSRKSGAPLANDTSFGIGFAPFSSTERLVLDTEHMLNSTEYKRKMPAVGEDVKVLGLRYGDKITLTLAVAFVSKFLRNVEEYAEQKEKVREDVAMLAEKATGREVDVFVNTGDLMEKGDVYITKTGLSCEAGDDGSVGRGNRVNGLITPFRRMSLEAAAGKNPVNHVGKIYNILAMELSAAIVKEHPEIRQCNAAIVSQIGRRIDEPLNLSLELEVHDQKEFEKLSNQARSTAEAWLDDIGKLTSEIAVGKYPVF